MHVCTYFVPINLVDVYIRISMDKLKISPADGARREVRESQRWVGLILFMYHEYHVCKKFNGSPSNSGGLTNWLTIRYCHPKESVIDCTHRNWKWKTKTPQVVGRLKIKKNQILLAKLGEEHTKCHDVLGLNLLCMEYVIHSIPPPPLPHWRKKGVGAAELHFTAAVISKNTWFTDYCTRAFCVENCCTAMRPPLLTPAIP